MTPRDLALMCYYAQEHLLECPEPDRAWALECTSYQVACFLAKHTRYGVDGVEWEVVHDTLVGPALGTHQWLNVIMTKVNALGGWRD